MEMFFYYSGIFTWVSILIAALAMVRLYSINRATESNKNDLPDGKNSRPTGINQKPRNNE